MSDVTCVSCGGTRFTVRRSTPDATEPLLGQLECAACGEFNGGVVLTRTWPMTEFVGDTLHEQLTKPGVSETLMAKIDEWVNS